MWNGLPPDGKPTSCEDRIQNPGASKAFFSPCGAFLPPPPRSPLPMLAACVENRLKLRRKFRKCSKFGLKTAYFARLATKQAEMNAFLENPPRKNLLPMARAAGGGRGNRSRLGPRRCRLSRAAAGSSAIYTAKEAAGEIRSGPFVRERRGTGEPPPRGRAPGTTALSGLNPILLAVRVPRMKRP